MAWTCWALSRVGAGLARKERAMQDQKMCCFLSFSDRRHRWRSVCSER